MLFAARREFSAIAFWDADLATPLETIPDFVEVLARHSNVEVGKDKPLIDTDVLRNWCLFVSISGSCSQTDSTRL